MKSNLNNFLTTAQAGKRLGYTASHVRRLISCGYLNAEKKGQDWLISDDDVTEFLKNRNLKNKDSKNDKRKLK